MTNHDFRLDFPENHGMCHSPEMTPTCPDCDSRQVGEVQLSLAELGRHGLIRLGRLCDFAVAEITDDFQNLAPCREHPTAATLVVVHRSHEFDFIGSVVAFTGRGVDLTSTFDLATIGTFEAFRVFLSTLFGSPAGDHQLAGSL